MFATVKTKFKDGFTLVELLVVIAIIGTLATIVIASVDSARANARDVKRTADLEAIETALQLYHDKHGTYLVAGTGWNGCGCGWLASEDGVNYVTAVTRGLYNEGFLNVPILDDPKSQPSYMIYLCDNSQSYSLSATKENPTTDNINYIKNVCNGSLSLHPLPNGNAIDTNYGKNFALANKTF